MRSILHSRGAILAGQFRQHFFAVFCLFLLLPGVHGFAATGTATALTVTSGGSAVTTVAAGNVIALTATVTSGGTALTTGQINFCDASVTYCTDIHLLGTAQLTSAGTAVVRLMPGIGSHSYKAVFAGTNAYSTSSSASSSLAVTLAGPYPTATTITSSGSAGSYALTASVAGAPSNAAGAPTGLISFLNTTNNNQVITTASLVASAQPLSYSMPNPGFFVFEPLSMVTGDFNGDGKPDILVLSGTLPTPPPVIGLGNGDGTFTSTTLTTITGGLQAILAVGDFNQDGNLDVLAGSNDGYTTLLGHGDGTFSQIAQPAVEYGILSYWVSGDFNGDGILDLAYTNLAQTGVTVLPGNGDGTFGTPINAARVPTDGSVVAGDFNGDGKLDLALDSPANSTITVLLGQGNGTFVVAAPVAVAGLNSLVTGDFNGDGKLDLVAVATGYGFGASSATVLLGNGDGTLTTAPATIPCNGPTTIAVGDFNGDGKADLAISNSGQGLVDPSETVLLEKGDRTFSVGADPALTFMSGPVPVSVADFNGDGLSDIATSTDDDGGPIVLLGQLFPATATASNIAVAGTGTEQVTASYPGDSNYGANVSRAIALTGTPIATITFSVPNHTYGDAPFTVAATSASTGAFTYSVVSGPATISGSTVSLTGAGSVALQASQAAAEGYAAATQTASLTVAPASLTVAANNLARVFGAANPTFTGSVTGAVNGDTFTENFSTTATASSIVGSYPIVPSVAGANLVDYTVSSTNGTLTVSQAGTTTTFALSNNNTTLTASVASLTSGTPTGTVAFYEGQTQVGIGTLANGTASYTGSAFPSGDVVVSAQYSGDANFTQSQSPSILVLSVTPVNTSVTVATAGSAVDQLNLAPAPGFTGTVQFSCSRLPQNAYCSFQPASVAFTGSTSASSASLTIQTGVSSQAGLWRSHSDGRQGPASTLAAVFWAPCIFLTTIARRRRRVGLRAAKLLGLALLLGGMGAALNGCGGGSSTTSPPPTSPTPAGTYTVQLVVSGPGGLSQTTSLNLTVQ